MVTDDWKISDDIGEVSLWYVKLATVRNNDNIGTESPNLVKDHILEQKIDVLRRTVDYPSTLSFFLESLSNIGRIQRKSKDFREVDKAWTPIFLYFLCHRVSLPH